MMLTQKSIHLGWRMARASLFGLATLPIFAIFQAQAQVNQPPPGPGPALKLDALDNMAEDKNHFSVSGDYMRGSGDLALPFEYAISTDPRTGGGVVARNIFGDRKAKYFGGTISYSRSEAWTFDVSVSQGQSDAEVDAIFTSGITKLTLKGYDFSNDDTWVQAYARYGFPALRGKRFNAYLRFGVTHVDNNLEGNPQVFDELQGLGVTYSIDSKVRDFTGNLGIGVSLTAFQTTHFRFSAVMEGEVFAGIRKQDIREQIVDGAQVEIYAGKQNVDALLFGGLGRSTLRLEYFPSASSSFSVFADGGIQVRNSWINFPRVAEVAGGGDEKLISELLWGPYARLGMRMSF